MSERRYLETRNFSYKLSENQSRSYQSKIWQVEVRKTIELIKKK